MTAYRGAAGTFWIHTGWLRGMGVQSQSGPKPVYPPCKPQPNWGNFITATESTETMTMQAAITKTTSRLGGSHVISSGVLAFGASSVLSRISNGVVNLLKRCFEFGNRRLELSTASGSKGQRTYLKNFDLAPNISACF